MGEVGVLEVLVEPFGLRLPFWVAYGLYRLLRLPPFAAPAAMA